ncbi:MAG TPA: response regulator transcription factor [Anaerolineae bacterium]|nr:response regulator transcription factor [Anaerolineae bacterium]HQK13358.1 response regulator transcription factor [Anaerolineae bacterium]
MEDTRILVVDDETAERVTLGEVLRLEGYHVSLAASGEQALAMVRQEPPFDLAILDLRLPGMDGLQVLDGIRRTSAETIVILITGYGTLETAVQALRKGAYDFLLKPCPVEEVLAAVRRALSELQVGRQRRVLMTQLQNTLQALIATTDGLALEPVRELTKGDDVLVVGDVQIDRGKHLVTYRGQPVELTPTEFRLLECLVERVDEVCTPQELVRCAQGYETDAWGARSIVRVHIRRLRRKLEPDPENPRYILNVRGVGYLFASSPEMAFEQSSEV